jgi:hypothetical protein
MLGILNNTFKRTLVEEATRIKIYNRLAFPILLHGREIWTLWQKDKNRLTSIEINFSEEQHVTHILTTKGMNKFWKS